MPEKLTLNKDRKIADIAPDWLKSFFYSDAFFIVMLVCAFASWASGYIAIIFVANAVFGTIMLLVLDDIMPVFSLLFFGMCAVSSADPAVINGYLPYLAIVSPLVIALIFHIFYYGNNFHLGKMFVPQLLISFAMMIGGCATISLTRYMGALGSVLLLGVAILVFYFLADNYCHPNKYSKTSTFMAKMLMYVGLLIVIEVITFYIRAGRPPTEWGFMNVHLGWGISNNVATMLLLTAPMCFYLGLKSKMMGVYALIGALQYIGIFLSFSRGGILFAAVTGVVVVIFTLVKAEHKKATLIGFAIAIAVILIFYFAFFDKANAAIVALLKQGAGLSGREDLYNEAWTMFKAHPIFGVGMGFDGNYYIMDVVPFYWFHSTFFQVMGCTGLVGLIAFGYFYFKRYAIVFKNMKRNKFSIFTFFSFLGFEMYSMMDTGTFIPIPFMLLVMLMTVVVEHENKEPQSDKGNVFMTEKYFREIEI
ncbi:MAG: O-antigen ligase family protein [Clostridia bacterium]